MVLKLDIDATVTATIVNNATVRAAFEASFKIDVANSLAGVSDTDINIHSVEVGSLIVNFTVSQPHNGTLPGISTALQSLISYTTAFDSPLTTTITISYTSTACDNLQTACGADATCATLQQGYQCECKRLHVL